ncbi:unnamed protein product [Bursaphelenchus xylophilus]|uniref:(pine wood nematode) hypothetical protein n=1 Tax=Bursaphelenchus xylophilus TaxID=6326 RepID=A0A1I7SCB5_BURXY|nr:unnamed protein product [Bursaphelenchus xylophilus]CAG9094414.1 unnamed protein product [Bursaphelenchus xylophilus]
MLTSQAPKNRTATPMTTQTTCPSSPSQENDSLSSEETIVVNSLSSEETIVAKEDCRNFIRAARIKSLIFDEHRERAQFMARKQIHLDPRIVEDVFHRYQHPYVPLYGNPEANLLFQRRCMKWETEMNLINLSKGIAPLYVENWVDGEAASDDFFFCTEYIYHKSAKGIIQSNMGNKKCDKQRHCCKNFLNKQRYFQTTAFRCLTGPRSRRKKFARLCSYFCGAVKTDRDAAGAEKQNSDSDDYPNYMPVFPKSRE